MNTIWYLHCCKSVSQSAQRWTSSYPGWINPHAGNLPHMICKGGYSRNWKVTMCQDLLNFNWGGTPTEKSQVPNLPKVLRNWKHCQDLPKFQFSGRGVFRNWKVTKCQDLPKFQFLGGGFRNWKVTKCQDLPKFQFSGGGDSGVNLWSGKFGPKFTVQPETCLCITVVSHILRMWRLITHCWRNDASCNVMMIYADV